MGETERGKKILVVDDTKGVREFLRDALDLQNYDVVLAKDGFQGFNFCREQIFDLVVTDIRMPGMTGLQLIEKIRLEKPGQNFVVMSGDPSDNEVKWLLEKNIRLLKKPFAIQALHAIVARAIASQPD